MAVRKQTRRKGNHVFDRTVKDLKTSVDALGRLLMTFVPGAASSRSSGKKSAVGGAARRGTKRSTRTVKASARTKATASQRTPKKSRRSAKPRTSGVRPA
jgi:hypothetical protein